MVDDTSTKVFRLSSAISASDDSDGEDEAHKKGPMSEKGQADGKRKDLEGYIGEEQG